MKTLEKLLLFLEKFVAQLEDSKALKSYISSD
jgi:hypothetical protein